MEKVTFDPFDAELGDAYNYHQNLPDGVRFPLYRQEFSADPSHWKRHVPPVWVSRLRWQEYRYSEVHSRRDLDKIIPVSRPGIYIFYARPDSLVHYFPQFAFYLGISNERDSNRPLRERLLDYLPASLSAIRKRQNIHRMLQLYYKQVWVAFALSNRASRDLKNAEEKLHGFIHPCCARRDFPADVKGQQKAFGVT